VNILFIGEKPQGTAPTLTWANALSRLDVNCQFIDLHKTATIDWIKKVRNADFIIYQGYSKLDFFEVRQLALAVFFGCPIIRKWSGSDIYYTINDFDLCKSVKQFNKIISLNLTSEHEGIIEELSSINIQGTLTPQVINKIKIKNEIKVNSPALKKSVLAYLPDGRYEFYGFSYIESLIKSYPNINFIIVADKKHSLAKYKNVQSLGWIENMEPIWKDIGLLIRMTTHDGFPRSIVEALAYKKYVVHNREYKGCWFASSLEELEKCLDKFTALEIENTVGAHVVKNLISGDSDKQLYNKIQQVRLSPWKRSIAFFNVFKYTFFMKKGWYKTS